MSAKKPSTTAMWNDPEDAPALDVAFFKNAEQYKGTQPKPRGRPKAASTKEAVKLRLDADIVAALRASGEGWQTRINDSLRAALKLAGRV